MTLEEREVFNKIEYIPKRARIKAEQKIKSLKTSKKLLRGKKDAISLINTEIANQRQNIESFNKLDDLINDSWLYGE